MSKVINEDEFFLSSLFAHSQSLHTALYHQPTPTNPIITRPMFAYTYGGHPPVKFARIDSLLLKKYTIHNINNDRVNCFRTTYIQYLVLIMINTEKLAIRTYRNSFINTWVLHNGRWWWSSILSLMHNGSR